MEKMKKKVTHFLASSDGGDWPPENAALFVKWFSDHLSEIPDECRDSARIEIEIDSSENDDCYVTHLRFTYLRDESDEEIDRRIFLKRLDEERNRAEVERLERLERQVLYDLKKKYES